MLFKISVLETFWKFSKYHLHNSKYLPPVDENKLDQNSAGGEWKIKVFKKYLCYSNHKKEFSFNFYESTCDKYFLLSTNCFLAIFKKFQA